VRLRTSTLDAAAGGVNGADHLAVDSGTQVRKVATADVALEVEVVGVLVERLSADVAS
jgi:hypothetical protein